METDPTPTQAEAQGMHPMSMMNDSCYLAITFLSSHHKHLPVSHLLTVLVIMDKPTIQRMNPTKLLDFIQSKLMVPLDRDDAQKLVSARITGTAFLEGARDRSLFREAGLTVGACVDLSMLAKTVEGKFYLINTTQTASRQCLSSSVFHFSYVGLFFQSSP
jgi:hypothetical protein